MRILSKKQKETLDCIKSYMFKHGYVPSIRELCTMLRVKSSSTMYTRMQSLFAAGYLETDADLGSPRAYRVYGVQYTEKF